MQFYIRRAFHSLSLVSTLALTFPISALAQEPITHPDVHLTVLHTNDTHGHLLPYSYPETTKKGSDISKLRFKRDIGGAARRGTLIKKIREERGHETLLIDAGDICDGTPFSTVYHGDADVAVMNALNYDFACPGNHEYNNSLELAKKLRDSAHFPFISANSKIKADGLLLYQPYVIKEISGVKIAFFGLMTIDAQTYPAARNDLTLELPLETAKRLVPELRKKADLVVAVTHIGFAEDKMMAKEVPGIDLIVGGHSHSLVARPEVVRQTDGVNQTLIVQDFQWAATLGRLDMTLHYDAATSSWNISKHRGNLIPITSSLSEDAEVATTVSGFWNPIKAEFGAVVGEASGDFAEKGEDSAEYNLVGDAVREDLKTEFDIENAGGVRSFLPRGPITYGDVVTLDPFGNTVVTFHATGKQIKRILETNSPHVSGIRYKLKNGVLQEVSLHGLPLEDDKLYFGATNSYYANFILKEVKDKTDTKQPRLNSILKFFRARKSVAPSYDNRRVIIGAKRIE